MSKPSVARTARAQSRPSTPHWRCSAVGLAVAGLVGVVPNAIALPAGEQVVAGQVNVARPSQQQLNINQGSSSAIVNWQSFSIGATERVSIQQPSSSSVLLNRVVGNDPTQIFGQLNANGRVFLVNPSGVLFAPGAQVNTGSLIASTLDIDNSDFLSGRYLFTGNRPGSVVNRGTLTAADGGTIALLGGSVTNDGVVAARLGTVALGAGERMTLDFQGDGLTQLRVDSPAVQASIANGGAIVADGGQIVMRAQAAEGLAATVVNQTGTVRARSLVERNGRIVLDGGTNGDTLVGGQVDASGVASGQQGGSIQVTGHNIAIVSGAELSARGDAGGGSVLVGGDAHGANASALPQANAVWMASDARIDASATQSGDGGKVVLWSTQSTQVHGQLRATGGASGGNGGFIETSGPYLETADASIDASAPKGAAGEWLLDPVNVEIVAGNASSNSTAGPSFQPTGSSSQVDAGQIQTALNAGTSVTVSTEPGPPVMGPSGPAFIPTEAGNITLSAQIVKSTGGDASLTLNAHNNIVINDSILVQPNAPSTGRLNVNLNADSDGNGLGGVLVNAGSIQTNGGNVNIYGQSNASGGRTGGAMNGGTFVGTYIGPRAAIDARSMVGGNGGNISISSNVIESAAQAAGIIADVTPTGLQGIAAQGGTLITQGGSITLSGIAQGTNLPAIGVAIGGAAAQQVFALAAAPGAGSTLISGGSVVINGVSTSSSLGLGVGVINADIVATGAGGVSIQGTDLSTAGGTGPTGAGLMLFNSSVTQPSGTMVITGASTGGKAGLIVNNTTIGGAGSSANIFLGAGNSGANDAIQLGNGSSITTSGVVNLRPRNTDVLGGGPFDALNGTPIKVNTAVDGGGFDLSAADLASVAPGVGRLVIGSSSHTGAITVGNFWNLPTGVTLQNSGAGSQGIQINAPISGQSLALVSGGTVTQSAPLNIDNLLLHGTTPQANFQLTNANNSIDRVAMAFDTTKSTANPNFGDVSVINQGSIAIGPVAAQEASGDFGVATVGTGSSVAAGDVFIRARGATAGVSANITLEHSLTTLGSDITLVMDGIFLNPNGSTLTPGGNGVWQVWANTWAGEQRGGLLGTQPYPNFYSCTYDGGCTAAPAAQFNGATPPQGSAPLAMGGNHFFYAQRPTVSVTPQSTQVNVTYGQPVELGPLSPQFSNSPPPADDNLTTAIGGGYAGALGPKPDAGTYTIGGNFTSPVGYAVSAPPITVVVNPAVLTYVANSATRVYGTVNPAFSGSVTGFVAGETIASATTGSLAFTSPATTASSVGLYAINGGGLQARNYTFAQAAGNATALSITPAVLTYVANPQSRRYGVANPAFTGSVTGFANGDSLASSTSGTLAFNSPAVATSPVGQYAILGSGLTSQNYTFVQAAGNATALTITPGILTYVANPVARTYGAANPPLTGSVTGFANGETQATATTGTLMFNSPVTPSSPVGQYAITGSGLSAANYEFVQAAGNATAFTVNPAVLTYIANPVSRLYGSANPALDGTVTGFVNGETQATATSGTAAFTTLATPATPVGQYAINGGGLSARNYVFVQATGNAAALTIDPAVLTYIAVPATRGFGDPNPAFTGSVIGFVNGESLATATTGNAAFTSPATAGSPIGLYAINGSGLVARNYRFVQAPGNATALTILGSRASPLLEIQNRTREDTLIYSRNIAGAGDLCLAADFESKSAGLVTGDDGLSQEWSRVRTQPRVAGCVALDRNHNSCADF